MTDQHEPSDEPAEGATRRRVLMMGAVAASSVVTIRPALAQTAGSVLNCEIPVPDAGRSANFIAGDGSLVAPGTPGAFPAAGRPLRGEDVRRALATGRPLPGYGYSQSRAYTNYIRRLQAGTSGFTCYASLQMPRR